MNQKTLGATSRKQFLPSAAQGNYSSPHSEFSRLDEPSGGMLSEYFQIIRRNVLHIICWAILGGTLALLVGLGAIPLYTTRTSLEIRSVNHDFLDMRSVAPTDNGTSADDDMNLQTQIKLLQSDSLLEDVDKRLLGEPHPVSIPRKDAFSTILRTLHLGGSKQLSYDALVEDAMKRVKVKPIGMTRLVEITCESYDAKFSASFCNTLTTAFQDRDLEFRSSEAQKTSEWLTQQVADIRLRAEESQRRLEQAVGGNGLVLSQTSTTSGEERLRSLQEELTHAQADRMQQEATDSVAHSADADTVPSVQDDPEHRAYELKLADLRTQLAQSVPTLTEENPKVIRIRAQIADAELGLKRTEVSNFRRQDNEYSAARHREALLQAAYNAQQASVSSDLQKAAQVSLLRKEVESEQQLYQTLLQRAKEAGFASALQATTIHVVDPAKNPAVPSSPRRKLAGGIGLAMGSLFGLTMAFYRDRNDNVFRVPGDLPRLLNVKELGVIPRAHQLRTSEGSFSLATMAQSNPIAVTRWGDNFSLAAEAYRNITFSILLANNNKGCKKFVVTSPGAGEGKTTVASNLGVALSKSRLRVVLVDGDLRRPSLHRVFGVDNVFGVRNILRGEVDLESVAVEMLTVKTHIPNVALIPAGGGSEDVVELLHSSHLEDLLTRLSREFDVVLIDTPPILHMADARIFAAKSDGAILVCRAGTTVHDQAADARDLFDHDGVRLIGSILNDYDPSSNDGGKYYASYHNYGASSGEGENVGATR